MGVGGAMGLHKNTRRRLQELFRGRTCCKCDRPATRLARDQYYCDRHFPYGKKDDGTRSYRHPKL
jgi:hypothetical protein